MYLGVGGGSVATAGAWGGLWRAPMTARRARPAKIGWGRLLGGSFAVLLLVMGGYSGWSFDTRAESVIDDELQAELDQIAADGAAALAAARAAAVAPTKPKPLATTSERRNCDAKRIGSWPLRG